MAPLKFSGQQFEDINGLGGKHGQKRKEVLYDGKFYDITDFIHRHPGGRLIEYYTEAGEDATAAIQQFHHRSFNKVSAIMNSFQSRPAEKQDFESKTAELDKKTLKRHQALTDDYNKLFGELKNEGYFRPSIPHVVYRCLEVLALFVLGFYLATRNGDLLLNGIGCILLGLYASRCGWLMHEAGHNSLTGYPRIDKFICSFVWGMGLGGSASWWNSRHNRHHAMPQRLTRDIDLESLPLMATNINTGKDPSMAKNVFVKYQAIFFLTTNSILIWNMWTLYIHPRRMIQKREYLEMFFKILYYFCWYHVGFYQFQIVVWFASGCIFTNLLLSHTHLPVTTERKHWVEYALEHTTDIEPSPLVNWWMGYLNCQIEHHLFPTMPQFRQPEIRDRVKALADKHNIPYHTCSYFEAVRKTFKNLHTVGHQLQED